MPEHLKALVVILALALPTFWLGRRALVPVLMDDRVFTLRRNVWFTITLIAFLAHNYWLYVLGTAFVLIAVRKRDPNPLALFFFVLFTVPAIQVLIPGLGILGHVFAIDHLRLLTLVVLLPAVVTASEAPRVPLGRMGADRFVLLYLLLLLGFQFVLNSYTGAMRSSFYLVIDILIPYYAASRCLRDGAALKEALAAFVMAAFLLVSVAFFEYTRRWLLYSALDKALGEAWPFGSYLGRDDSLRALASTGHPIALGYVIAIAMGLFLFVSPLLTSRKLRIGCWLALAASLFFTGSRGPWIGAAVAMLFAVALGPQPVRRYMRLFIGAAIGLPLLIFSPWGDSVLRYVPFIGTVDTGSLDYRQQLFDVSILVLQQNPIFGAYDYMQNPAMEQLRQGEGLIDMVNTYLAVAMSTGLVGLTLFAGTFIAAAWSAWRVLRLQPPDSDRRRVGAGLIAAIVAMMITIATTSPVGAIALVSWMFAGLAIAYATVPSWADTFSRSFDAPVPQPRGLRAGYQGPGVARFD
jgi:O-antigen ligase